MRALQGERYTGPSPTGTIPLATSPALPPLPLPSSHYHLGTHHPFGILSHPSAAAPFCPEAPVVQWTPDVVGAGRVSSDDWCLFLEPTNPGVLVPLSAGVGETWSGLFKRPGRTQPWEQLGVAVGTQAEDREPVEGNGNQVM